MIDWIKAIIPCHHTDRVTGGRIICLHGETEEIEWETDRRKAVEVSFSAKIHVNTYDPGYLLVDGNPSKFLQGHNVFGTNDVIGLCTIFFDRVTTKLGLQASDSDRDAWQAGDYALCRVDVNESFLLRNQTDVAAWLRAAIPTVRSRYQSMSAYGGDTVCFGRNSRRIGFTLYNKRREMDRHRLPADIPHREALYSWAERALRAEVRIWAGELKRRGLDKGSAWRETGLTQQLMEERVKSLKMSNKMRLTDDQVSDLPPRLAAVYKLWTVGEDLRALYPKATYYRYRGELLKHGIDVTVPPRDTGGVVPLLSFLTAEYMAEPPDWARGTKLLVEPDACPQRQRTKLQVVNTGRTSTDVQ